MAVLIVLVLSLFGVSLQPKSQHDLRDELDNPVFPSQVLSLEYSSFPNYGSDDRNQDFFYLKQRYYSPMNSWTMVHQLQLSLVDQPLLDEDKSIFGLGDFTYRGYFTPVKSGNLKWGFGPAFQVPTGTDPNTSTKKWSAGPTLAVVYQSEGLSLGGNVWQLWSFAGESDKPDVNVTFADPIVKLNIGKKTTVGLLDTIKVDWTREPKDRWTIPVGLEVGQFFQKEKSVPTRLKFGVFNNVTRPHEDSNWYWRVSLEFAE